MKHITRAVLLGHTFLLVLALSADVGAQTGTISGQVIDEASGVPLVGASVHVLNPDLAVSAGAATDGDGGYAVENLPMGTYAVEATVGYRTVISRDIVVGARQSATVNFRLLTTPFKLTETVISASRRAENIVDASVSISKVDAEEVVRNASASSIIGLIQNVKGIDYTQRGIYTETYSARGFNGAVGPNSRMIVLLDGIDTGAGAAGARGGPEAGLSTLTWIAAGVAVAAVGAGFALSSQVSAKLDERDALIAGRDVGGRTKAGALEDDATSLALMGNAAFVTGGVALSAALLTWHFEL